jgi:hypothetical protein
MNTPDADKLIKTEAALLAKRQADMAVLQGLLAAIPGVNSAHIPLAIDELMAAADAYLASMPIVDAQGRRSRPGIAEARASVLALHKSLAAVQAKLSALPLNAFTELANAYEAPMGRLKAEVAQVYKATDAALKSLKTKPDKTPDHARNVLAYQVAVVFDDILKVKPTTTTPKQLTQNLSTARGGAAYALVLDATLNVAGVANCDLGPLISAGLRLLTDPKLPSRE